MLLKDLAEIGFFEGTEKLLEIWFEGDEISDLRHIPRYELESMLEVVNCTIVSFTNNDSIDSYVLSESSMFISKNRFIIKTCGITKLLYSVETIIHLAKKYGNMAKVQNFFYSRKVFLHPEEQCCLHKSFKNEVAFLEQIIPNGSAYVFGQVESQQWYLFTMDGASSPFCYGDITLEIIMSDLDSAVMSQFTKMAFQSPDELIMKSGISRLIPGSVNDGLIFDPIGFSLNGLFKDNYYTIHVTPQDNCSYVSFETNFKSRSYGDLIKRVLSTFKPNEFIITFFAAKDLMLSHPTGNVDIGDYHCDDHQSQQLKNYSFTYQHFIKSRISD